MTLYAAPHTVIAAEAGIHDTLQQRCVLGNVMRAEASVDGCLRGHDGIGGGARVTEELQKVRVGARFTRKEGQ